MTEIALQLEHVTYTYEGMPVPALRDVGLTIPAGTCTALLGCNGSGKSTLSRHLNGLLHPQQGTVAIMGKNIADLDTADVAPLAGLVFQHPDHQIFCSTVEKEISFGPENLGWEAKRIQERTEEALRLFHLERYGQAPPSLLSLGLRKKICLAGVFAMDPEIFILDEPTAGLDRRDTKLLMELLRQWQSAGKTILLITHDLRSAAAYTDQCIIMQQGSILAHGTTRRILGDEALLKKAQLQAPSIVRLSQRYAVPHPGGTALTVQEFMDCQYVRAGGLNHEI